MKFDLAKFHAVDSRGQETFIYMVPWLIPRIRTHVVGSPYITHVFWVADGRGITTAHIQDTAPDPERYKHESTILVKHRTVYVYKKHRVSRG